MSDAVKIALITGSVTVILAIISLITLLITMRVKRNQERLHKQINSRMDQLLELAKQKGAADNQKVTDSKPQDQK